MVPQGSQDHRQPPAGIAPVGYVPCPGSKPDGRKGKKSALSKVISALRVVAMIFRGLLVPVEGNRKARATSSARPRRGSV
jgi:hypothetical protein